MVGVVREKAGRVLPEQDLLNLRSRVNASVNSFATALRDGKPASEQHRLFDWLQKDSSGLPTDERMKVNLRLTELLSKASQN
jgi:hypothetical protein